MRFQWGILLAWLAIWATGLALIYCLYRMALFAWRFL